jgi:hypothetical protein
MGYDGNVFKLRRFNVQLEKAGRGGGCVWRCCTAFHVDHYWGISHDASFGEMSMQV